MRHRITSPFAQAMQEAAYTSPHTPLSPASPDAPDAYEVVRVLAELDAVPRDELPDGGARNALAEAIRAGAVSDIYRQTRTSHHLIELAWVAVEPRRRVSDWVRAWELSQRCQGLTPALDFLSGAEGGA